MAHLDIGVHKGGDHLVKVIYQISENNTISTAELSRQIDNDEELTYVRGVSINSQLSQQPEPCRTYQSTLSSRYELVFQDDKIIIPQGLQVVFVNFLHWDHAGLDRMKEDAP